MPSRPTAVRTLRKTHRIFGVVLGLQFVAWTLSGLYFSWSDLDHVHGDPWLLPAAAQAWKVEDIQLPAEAEHRMVFDGTFELRSVLGEPFWWVNEERLIHATTGRLRDRISEQEAQLIVRARLAQPVDIVAVNEIVETGPHHEYRERPLPAWQVQLSDGTNLYVDGKSGEVTRVRNTAWRVFDALWMFHTMDYATRDNFNNLLLRVFSLAGLVTVLSGLVLFGATLRPRRKVS